MSIASHPIRHHAGQNNRAFSLLILFFLVPLFFTKASFSAPTLPAELHEYATVTIENIYKENYDQAETEAKKIIRKFPEHPAGYFFEAIAIDAWMAHYWSKSRENEFYKYCDLSISKGEELLERDRNNEWAKFFIAGANGYKGTYEARFERWITAFRYGWQGVSMLIDMESSKSSIMDINYGIGNYDYWRSAMIKTLWFMPKVDDRRQKGIDRLYMVKEKGVYTSEAASSALIDILLNEKRYQEALELSEEMLKKFPSSQLFLFGKAKAHFGLDQNDKSVAYFEMLQKKCEQYTEGDSFMVIVCHYWLAKNFLKLKNFTRTIMECNRMTCYKISADTKKMLEKYFAEAESMKKLVYAEQGKSGAGK